MSAPSQRERGKLVTDDDARIVYVTRDADGAILGVFRTHEGMLGQSSADNLHTPDVTPLFADDEEVRAFLDRMG